MPAISFNARVSRQNIGDEHQVAAAAPEPIRVRSVCGRRSGFSSSLMDLWQNLPD
jgi:hypothetical protein